jgi:hypothetical protein
LAVDTPQSTALTAPTFRDVLRKRMLSPLLVCFHGAFGPSRQGTRQGCTCVGLCSSWLWSRTSMNLLCMCSHSMLALCKHFSEEPESSFVCTQNMPPAGHRAAADPLLVCRAAMPRCCRRQSWASEEVGPLLIAVLCHCLGLERTDSKVRSSITLAASPGH